MIFPETFPDGFTCQIEGSHTLPGAEVEVSSFLWLKPQDAILETSQFLLDLSLPDGAPGAEARFLDAPGMKGRPHGRLFAVPPGRALHSRWREGRMRAVACLLDMKMLGGVAEREWNAEDLERALDFNSAVIHETMLRLAREALAPDFGSEIVTEALCRTLVVELQREFWAEPIVEPVISAKLGGAQIRDIRDRLSQWETPPPSIADLAKSYGVTPRHFARLFVQSTGESLSAFAVRQRIDFAKTALAGPRSSIKQIAFRCGFKSQAAFSVAFKRHTGLAPRAFRIAAQAR